MEMHVANRTAKFLSGVVATVLGCAPLATLPRSAAAADECLSKPSGATPQGQHWYYRIDRANNKRQCWYLRAEGESVAKAAPGAAAQAGAAAPAADAASRRSIQDAHAEFPAPLPPAAPAQVTTPAPASPLAAPATMLADAAGPSPVAAPPAAIDTAAPGASGPAAPATRPAELTPPSSGIAPSAADAAAAPKPTGSLQTLLLVVLGALALAGFIASIVVRVARRRAAAGSRTPRRVNWDAAEEMRAPPWAGPAEISSAPAAAPQEAEQAPLSADFEIDRITALLEQLVREGPKLDRTISAIDPAAFEQSRPGQPGVPA
jgi:hypothetical protein